MNGTTWLDRTNYFETMPSHQLELALWLEADRMGTLLDALSQENLDNQREVVKNEKRWSYDNRPYGTLVEKLQAHLYPPEHPYHHPTIGSMDDLDAASLEDVTAFFRTYYAPNNAVLAVVGDVDPAEVQALGRAVLRGHPGQPGDPAARRHEPAADARRRASARRSTTGSRCRGSTSGSGPRRSATRASTRSRWPCQILAGGKGSRLHRRLVRDERIAQDVVVFILGFVGGASIAAGWATVRPGVEPRAGRGGLPRGARPPDPRAGHRRRAGPGQGPRSRPTSSARCSGSRSGPTGWRCTRPCSTTRT